MLMRPYLFSIVNDTVLVKNKFFGENLLAERHQTKANSNG